MKIMRPIWKPGLLGLMIVPLVGCAAQISAPATAASGDDAPLSRASLVARQLVAADAAYEAGDKAALGAALGGLANRSVRPLEGTVDDPVAMWRSAVPDTPPLRGRALGPGYVRGTLAPGVSANLNQLFLSGKAATIAGESLPYKDLRLRIYDAAGQVICDRTPINSRDCRFTPVFTQRYRIELRNDGEKTTRYYLVVD